MEMQGITYNTTMGLVVGAIMILVPIFLHTALARMGRTLSGFDYAFVILGLYLGGHRPAHDADLAARADRRCRLLRRRQRGLR
ncbi:hypothetical protein [Corynebacterium frankenforstense]